ncbi:MAG: hypothetical protein N2490_01620 [Ignavibacteria bacterium]|nr:hypothetical protein [Ignavibacteria bacterium]
MSIKARFWLFLLIVASIIWLGGINVRIIIGNQLLSFDEFDFRLNVPPDEENTIFRLLAYSSVLVAIGYVITFISAIFFLKTYKINLRQNVWLLMSALLFFVFSPVEFYNIFLDYKFYKLLIENPADRDNLLLIFGERVGLLKGVPWIAILSYYTAIAIAIFQPLKKTEEELKKNDETQKKYAYEYHMHEEDDIVNL